MADVIICPLTASALGYLAECFESRAPGLAVVLHNWARVLAHDPLAVAKEAIAALAGAEQLAAHAPEDVAHRDAVEVLQVVFLGAARSVFRRDARRPS